MSRASNRPGPTAGVPLLACLLAAAGMACGVGFESPEDDDDTVEDDVTPVVGDLSVEVDYSTWKLLASFTWSDPDNDVRSGYLNAYVDGDIYGLYEIPHPSLTLLGDTGELRLSLEPFAVSHAVDLALELVDAEGHASLPAVITVDLQRTFRREEEDNGSVAGCQRLGELDMPAAITGRLDELSYDETGAYSGDLDYFGFRLGETTQTQITLYWPTQYNDLGISLYREGGDLLAMADDEGLIPPEVLGSPLDAGQTYLLLVAGRTGAAVDYVVLLDGEP